MAEQQAEPTQEQIDKEQAAEQEPKAQAKQEQDDPKYGGASRNGLYRDEASGELRTRSAHSDVKVAQTKPVTPAVPAGAEGAAPASDATLTSAQEQGGTQNAVQDHLATEGKDAAVDEANDGNDPAKSPNPQVQ
jgi:hypothetical protein